jgi:hypothetical protein
MPDDGGVTFHISHRYGGDDSSPPLGSLPALLDEVDEDPNDKEHVGVSVVHESGWAIGVDSGWVVTLENVEDLDIEPRHIVAGSDRRLVHELMRAAAEGDLATLEAQPWHAGYSPG